MTTRSFNTDTAWVWLCDHTREIAQAFRAEIAAQKDQAFLWSPVFVGFGIAGYFALPSEPPFLLGVVAVLGLMSVLILQAGESLYRTPLLMFLLIALGFLAAQGRTLSVHTTMLSRDLGPVMVEGDISKLEPLGPKEGARVELRTLNIEKLKPEDTPRKIRLRIRKEEGLYPGQRIRVLAQLHPPSGPSIPDGFNFRRYLYYQGIGAVGFAFKAPEVLGGSKQGAQSVIEYLRTSIARNVEQTAAMPEAGLVAALLTGQREAIPEDDEAALRYAGLAHILAISGLHIGLFSGVVFFMFRLSLAAIPGWAERYPIKKYAALSAFFAALSYMFLAGASVSAQRSLLMTGVVFLAIIMDRSAISLRLVAFAALVVLLVMPESLMAAGFQMSFVAVTALVVFYERTRLWWADRYARAGLSKRVAFYFISIIATTVIASLATAPFALFHFQYTSVFSILANVMVIPLVAFIIMPLAVLVLVSMPFGLSALPIQFMAQGCSSVLEAAHWVASMPHAIIHVQAWPLNALALFSLAFVFFILWHGRLKYLALIPTAAGLLLINAYNMPNVLISQNFETMGIYDGADLFVSSKKKNQFVTKNWERSFGLEEGAAKAFPEEGRFASDHALCAELGCELIENGQKISIIYKPETLSQACARSDLVLSFAPIKSACADRTPIIDKWDAYDNGSYGFWSEPNGKLRIKNAAQIIGDRPWKINQ